MRHPVLPLLLLLAGWLAPARAEEPSAPLARLVAPAAGAELEAGSLAVVEWMPDEGLAAMPHAEEWEAFLSVDGGRTYPLRVTPHLDLALRRFSFRVPDTPTRDARLMLRFGDERREVGYEAPQRFAIARRAGAAAWSGVLPTGIALRRGERPRERERGVLLWVDGSRQGEGLREVAAPLAGLSWRKVRPAAGPFLALLWPAPERAGLPLPAEGGSIVLADGASRFPTPGASDRPPSDVPVRLLIHRFNE